MHICHFSLHVYVFMFPQGVPLPSIAVSDALEPDQGPGDVISHGQVEDTRLHCGQHPGDIGQDTRRTHLPCWLLEG